MQKVALPIDEHLDQIIEKIFSHPPFILTASPGSGKTTRVPAKLLTSVRQTKNLKKIIVIVPKRLAAVAACDRIASENNWVVGIDVGYQVRFESVCTPQTQLIFMTEGLFLKKIQDSNFWTTIGFIILDEFHERSASIDLILGLSFERKILNNDLQIIVMSATLNTEQLKTYFGEFNIIEITQRPFRLEIIYQKTVQLLNCDHKFYENLKNAALQAFKLSKKDILIFLPGFREILNAHSALKSVFINTPIEFIYGGMSLPDQKKVLNKTTSERRIILATNIAESSVTVSDVDCVIDCGLEKTVVREKKMGFTKLETVRISQFSAKQRAGRAARTSDGVCIKLWHEVDERSLPEQKKPEILQSDLTDEILLLAQLGIQNFEHFSWLDQPSTEKIKLATEKLKHWSLIFKNNEITDQGKAILKIPLDLASSILLYELCLRGFATMACHLFSQLETLDLSKRQKHSPYDLNSDLDYLFDLSESAQQKKIYTQLLGLSKLFISNLLIDLSPYNLNANSNLKTDFNIVLLEIFAKYFQERICIKKTNTTGLSASGRGIEFSDTTALMSEKIPNDYVIALSGFEKSPSTTLIQLGFGYSKSIATPVLKKYLSTENKIEFKSESQKFIKKTVQKFGEFIFNESSPETLSEAEVSQNWKSFVNESPKDFLKLNLSFEKLISKLNFLKTRIEILNLKSLDFEFIENFDTDFHSRFAKILTENINDFQNFLTENFIFYTQDLISENIKSALLELPDTIELPTGRSVFINYTDPKAPLISAKIQDCFLWVETPRILNHLIPLTVELLAPNKRPAQITNDLNNFWKNSYKDVRKELRARYPKHSWPEDVLSSVAITKK